MTIERTILFFLGALATFFAVHLTEKESESVSIGVNETVFRCDYSRETSCGMNYYGCTAAYGLTPVQNFRCMVNQPEITATQEKQDLD